MSFCCEFVVYLEHVCVCPESLRCAASSAALGPFAFHVVSM